MPDTEFGLKGELALFRFLNNKYNGTNWRQFSDVNDKCNLECNIEWMNQTTESFKPFDMKLTLIYNINSESNEYHKTIDEFKIEVKATRKTADSIFYISTNELREAIKEKGKYIIARMVYLNYDKDIEAIKVNEEFGVNFYLIKNEVLSDIQERIPDWEEFNEERKIMINLEHLSEIPIHYDHDTKPKLKKFEPWSTTEYKTRFANYISDYYFKKHIRYIDGLLGYFLKNDEFRNQLLDRKRQFLRLELLMKALYK